MENIDLNLACFISLEKAICGDSDLYNTCAQLCYDTIKHCEGVKIVKNTHFQL